MNVSEGIHHFHWISNGFLIPEFSRPLRAAQLPGTHGATCGAPPLRILHHFHWNYKGFLIQDVRREKSVSKVREGNQ